MVTQCQKKSRYYLGGCAEAKILAKSKISCTDNCPFTECLDFLDDNVRRGIRVTLRHMRRIRRTYDLRDSGETIVNVAKRVRCPQSRVEYWLAKRKKNESLFTGDISGLIHAGN